MISGLFEGVAIVALLFVLGIVGTIVFLGWLMKKTLDIHKDK